MYSTEASTLNTTAAGCWRPLLITFVSEAGVSCPVSAGIQQTSSKQQNPYNSSLHLPRYKSI